MNWAKTALSYTVRNQPEQTARCRQRVGLRREFSQYYLVEYAGPEAKFVGAVSRRSEQAMTVDSLCARPDLETERASAASGKHTRSKRPQSETWRHTTAEGVSSEAQPISSGVLVWRV